MKQSPLRIGVVALLALALGYVVIAVSWSAVARTRNPALALMLAPWDARAKARLADASVASNDSLRAIGAAAREARGALQRDATIPGAWRMLGLSAAARNDEADASRLMHVAERMSRRDLPSQTWLIEERVRSGDIPGALRHYDIALRSSSAAANILMPILVNASTDPTISKELENLLRHRSPWRTEFLQRLANTPSPDGAVRLIEAAAGNEDRPLPDVYLALANHYIGRRSFNAGLRILYLAAGEQRPMPLLRAGNFDRESRFPPYDWRLTTAANPNVMLTAVPGRPGYRLEMNATSGNGGIAADQLLALEPGTYMLRARKGTQDGIAPAQIQLRVECASTAASLTQLTLASGASWTAFRVPAKECSAQWIRVVLVPDFSASDIGGWVDDITLKRMP